MLSKMNYSDDNTLRVLIDRTLSVSSCIQVLSEEGYIPNRNKFVKLGWCSILIQAYKNIDIFSEEQHKQLDVLTNKVLAL